jgi:hypothetical protein
VLYCLLLASIGSYVIVMIEWTISAKIAFMPSCSSSLFSSSILTSHAVSVIRKYCQGRMFRAKVLNGLVQFDIVAFLGSISRAVSILCMGTANFGGCKFSF